MNMYLLPFVCVIFLGCRFSAGQVSGNRKLEPAFLSDKQTVHPELKGVWKSIGNGYLLDATNDRMALYSYTKSYCYKEKKGYWTQLLHSTALFSRKGDTLHLYLHDYGEKTTELQARKIFVRIRALPGGCTELSALQQNDPVFLFDLFLETLECNYAFARERDLNWANIRKQYQTSISAATSLEELFQRMGEVVSMTKDQHTKIIAKDGRKHQYAVTPSAKRVWEAFEKQNAIENSHEYFDLFFETNYKNISDSLLLGQGKKVANGKIEWGFVKEDIGYIHIHSLTGFASPALPRKQHMDSLNFSMQEIMKALRDTKALIVDISFNFGGYDAAGLTIASYFTKETVQAYTLHTYYGGEFYETSTFNVIPATETYSKPVYLLTTDISRSAAETFAMQMKALPHVTLVGSRTLGILSNMLGKNIGGFYLTCSNGKYESTEGAVYEVNGVEVDIPREVFSSETILQGHMEAVRSIVKLIESKE
ncbi:S41 family peptidase [Rapidithrix thailandica]|uniref:S41 family peptidase n=1 Tax=Rapidithrix thailandica TaxID=413964 RepID=A0AAW9SJV4_9BACT